MSFPSNKIVDIRRFFRNNLIQLYTQTEIDSFFFILIEEYSSLTKSNIFIDYSLSVSESVSLKLYAAYKDLLKQKPIQYIIKKVQFLDLTLHVCPGVLIPRTETELLTDHIIKQNQNKKIKSIIDIGTGSGCIAIKLKKTFPLSDIYATDISDIAITVAKKNAIENNVYINFIKNNVFNIAEIINKFPTFDIIISNPPYIKISEKKFMLPNVLNYEPEEALFVPDNEPLKFYATIADFAKIKLSPKGRLYFEINEQHGNYLLQLLKDKNFADILLEKDFNNKDRIVSCGLVVE